MHLSFALWNPCSCFNWSPTVTYRCAVTGKKKLKKKKSMSLLVYNFWILYLVCCVVMVILCWALSVLSSYGDLYFGSPALFDIVQIAAYNYLTKNVCMLCHCREEWVLVISSSFLFLHMLFCVQATKEQIKGLGKAKTKLEETLMKEADSLVLARKVCPDVNFFLVILQRNLQAPMLALPQNESCVTLLNSVEAAVTSMWYFFLEKYFLSICMSRRAGAWSYVVPTLRFL